MSQDKYFEEYIHWLAATIRETHTYECMTDKQRGNVELLIADIRNHYYKNGVELCRGMFSLGIYFGGEVKLRNAELSTENSRSVFNNSANSWDRIKIIIGERLEPYAAQIWNNPETMNLRIGEVTERLMEKDVPAIIEDLFSESKTGGGSWMATALKQRCGNKTLSKDTVVKILKERNQDIRFIPERAFRAGRPSKK